MTEELDLSPDYVQSLQSAAIRKLNLSSVLSLISWGLLNIVLWLIIGRGNTEILSNVSNPSTELYFIIYSGLILGALMLIMAFLGYISKHGLAILLDGIGLMIIGLWNILYIFITPGIIKPYGYEIPGGMGSGTVWLILGASQIIWAVRAWSTYSVCRDWPSGSSREEARFALKNLGALLAQPASREGKVFKGSIVHKGFMGYGDKTADLVGIVQDDMIYFFSSDYKVILCFLILDFTTHSVLDTNSLILRYDHAGTYLLTTLEPSSAIIFMELTGQTMLPQVIAKNALTKDSPIDILLPYIKAPDPLLRYQTVKALGASNDKAVPELLINVLLEDEGLARAAVIEIYTQQAYEISPELFGDLMQENDKHVLPPLLAYVRKYPKRKYLPAIEQFMSQNPDPAVSKGMEKLAKACLKASG